MRKKLLFVSIAMPLLFTSCQKQALLQQEQPVAQVTRFPQTPKEKETVAILKEVGNILQEVYQDPKAYYEVCAAIFSGYYADESVLLKDVLYPKTSLLYQTPGFIKQRSQTGTFKKDFFAALQKGDYPNLKKALGTSVSTIAGSPTAAVPADADREIFSRSNGVSIYFPYSENFAVPLTTAYFDNVNSDAPTLVPSLLATIVSADGESDAGIGSEGYRQGKLRHVYYRTVAVNDAYSELHATHIVGTGVQLSVTPPDPTSQVFTVFIGEVKCVKKDYDKLITFNGYLQGGGPDLRFCRGSGYLVQDASSQIVNPQNVVQVNPTRKQCRNGQWISVYSIWDGNWQPDNLNQVFAIYEEDRKGTHSVDINLKTTIKTNGTSNEGNVGFSWTFNTEDDIIRQLSWNRAGFMAYNKGGLVNGCGLRNGFTVYDCNSNVAYTMPVQ